MIRVLLIVAAVVVLVMVLRPKALIQIPNPGGGNELPGAPYYGPVLP